MSKKTAVNWLMDKLPTIDKYDPYYEYIIQQALAIEKENSEISFFAGYNYEGGHPIDEHEEYYTKTYEK